jgi:hypothetical protein
MESDTPRTESMQGNRFVAHVPVLFARTLERELNAAKADLAQRTAERDEARREICEREARENWIVTESPEGVVINTPAPEREARLRGWNCFDTPHTNATDVPVRDGGEP